MGSPGCGHPALEPGSDWVGDAMHARLIPVGVYGYTVRTATWRGRAPSSRLGWLTHPGLLASSARTGSRDPWFTAASSAVKIGGEVLGMQQGKQSPRSCLTVSSMRLRTRPASDEGNGGSQPPLLCRHHHRAHAKTTVEPAPASRVRLVPCFLAKKLR